MSDRPVQESPLGRRAWNAFVKLHVVLYRSSGGRAFTKLKGAPCLLLDHAGRKTGRKRTNPLIYVADGDALAIVASAGGSPTDPGWWRNLKANPETTVQVKGERRRVRARQATPEEKGRLWPQLNEVWPEYDEYQKRTDREIPVILLEPAG